MVWPPFGSLEMLVAPLGATWAPKGLSLGSLVPPFCSLGMPVFSFGHLGLPRGAWHDFGSKIDFGAFAMPAHQK